MINTSRVRPVAAAVLSLCRPAPQASSRSLSVVAGISRQTQYPQRLQPLSLGALAVGMAFSSQPVAAQSATAPAQGAPAPAQSAAAPAQNVPGADADQSVAVLPPIDVSGTNSDYSPATSSIGGKVPTAIRDIPQSMTIIDRAVMDAQGIGSLQDALRYVPGITIGSAEGGTIGNNINLRGFSARTDIFLDGMRDRGQYYRDTFFLESVEVLKGPSSMLFGRGSTGGVINQVSKIPSLRPFDQVTAAVGTDDYYRATADVNVPIDPTSAFRISAMGQNISTTRDVMNNQDYGIAPSVRTGIGTPTEFILSAMLLHNNDMPDYGIPPLNGAPAPVSPSNFYGLTDDHTVQDVASVTARIKHTFNEQVSLRNQTQYNHYTIDAQETGPSRVGTWDGQTFTGIPTSATGNFTDIPPDQLYVLLGSHDRNITDSSIYNQTDLVAKFNTGSVQHVAIAGIEIGHDSYDNQAFSRVDPNIAGPNPGLAVVSLLNPSYGQEPADTVRTETNHANSTANTVGVYVNDTISFSPQWKVIAGVREDWFNASINNSITLPLYAAQNITFTSVRAGVLYQPTDTQTYYAAYGTSFDPSLETLTVTNGQQNIPPESNKSYEVGGKWDVLGGDLQLASALFQVTKSNARSQIETGVYDVTGEVRVRGVEVSATGHLTPRWQIIAGYTYLNADIVKASVLDGTQGKVPANTPENAASIWTTYSISQEWEVGGGVTSQSSVYASNTNVVTVPGYARLDATVAFHQPRYDIRLNVINATNTQYFASVIPSDAGRSVPAAGRTGIITLTYRF